ncbi:MAG: helix-turn-helix domain-containing protein [Firmicutes bacterium]|nr:helix-turn-helix domain-containing protein [Bacillota bacterium]
MKNEKIRLRELREEKNLTQLQLAKELGFSRNTISQYETGTREPDIKTIKKLCDFFDVSADYLLGFKEF